MSVPIGGWAARIPEVRRQVGADDALWGLATTVPAAGNVVGLGAIVLLVGRVRNETLAVVGAVLVLVTVPSTAAASRFPAVVVGLTTWALVAHIMDVPMGAMALEVQRRYGRPVMGSFDACFAVGTLAGGVVGTAAAALGVGPWAQFTVCSGLLGTALAATARWLPDDGSRPVAARPVRLRRRFTRGMVPIAAVAFLGGYVAEATVLWCAVYVADTEHGGPVLGGIAYTATATAGTVALLLVDRVTARIGVVRTVRLAALFGAAGFAAGLALGHPAAAVAGFVLLAVGMAAVNPGVYTLAGEQPDLSAGEGVSVVEMGQMPGAAIAAPALIGVLGGAIGLRAALATIVFAALAIGVLAGRMRVAPAGDRGPGPS